MKKIAFFASAVFLTVFLMAAYSSADEVVVYTSVDQVFSEPIFRLYEKKTGIKVKAVFDVEASKTVGLVNRLIAEKKRPKCDVFWNGEIGKTIELKNQGILASYHSKSAEGLPAQFIDKDYFWTGFGARARVLIYNTDLVLEKDLPKSIFELTQSRWKGKVAMAYPLFGTTATHVAAMYDNLGVEKTQTYLKAMKANDVVIVDGNSVVRDVVVEGKFPIGFTDTDDANVAVQSGKPVKTIYPDKDGLGTLLIPNTVALIKNAPHETQAKAFIDFLLSPEVESALSFSEYALMPLRDGVKKPSHIPAFNSITPMKVNYYQIGDNMKPAAEFCQKTFVR